MGGRRRITVCGLPWVVVSRRIACLALCLLTAGGHAQDEYDPTIPTLRVYTNLLQIPTLVLNAQHKPIPNLAEGRFLVSIDSGPKSHVAHVRVEGEDPIALSILVDSSQVPGYIRSRIPDAITGLIPKSLRPGDSVSLYDLNCQLSRSVVERPTTAAGLGETAHLLWAPQRQAAKSHGSEPCPQPHWNLLDAIVAAVQGLQDEPSRRVLLVLSDGKDRGSRTTWEAARTFASSKGVAIFGILSSSDTAVPLIMPLRGARGMTGVETVANSTPTDMSMLCESTGGMVLDNTDSGLALQMRNFLTLVRDRYIVEFPKPNAEAGSHRLEISVEKLTGASVWSAGASVPVADPELAKDPNTIISGPENTPAVGTKKPRQ
jgi:VWFA-related protein